MIVFIVFYYILKLYHILIYFSSIDFIYKLWYNIYYEYVDLQGRVRSPTGSIACEPF